MSDSKPHEHGREAAATPHTNRRRFLQATGGAGLAGLVGGSGTVGAHEGEETNYGDSLTVTENPEEVHLLVFSATDGFRHGSIEKGNQTIREMEDRFAAETGAETVTIDVIDDPDGNASEFPSDAEELVQYDAVIWNSTTGSPLNEDQQAAFEAYIQSGGGYAGIHAAADTHYDWAWYGDLVGAYFDGHPAVQEADIAVEDRAHPSAEPLPSRWSVTDEWYDYDRNPRGDVHVLATLDESSYDGAGMADGHIDHPIAWCHRYQGGRAWYTGRGHTEESFDEAAFRDHLFWGIMWSAGFVAGGASATVWDAYEQVTVSEELAAPMSLSIAPDGRIFVVQREADVVVIDPETDETTTALEREFYAGQEDGGLGIAIDPKFAETRWVYVYYSPAEDELDADADTPYNLLSRFTVEGDQLDSASEVEILRVPTQRETCCHAAGELQFGPDGSLYLSTGDDTNPFESDGYAPIDERDGRKNFDAQRSAGDTSDLRGSLLRIIPEEDGSYSIPEDNLFAGEEYADERADGLVAPEIYSMGLRNPFRFHVDSETGWVYLSDYGPDAGDWNDDRGPLGIVEHTQIREAGNQGWPYVHGPHPYVDYDFETGESGELFDPENLTNDSPNNDGLEDLPPAADPTIFVPRNWDTYTNYPEGPLNPVLESTPVVGPGTVPAHDEGKWETPDQAPYPEVTDQAPMGGPLVRLPDDTADTALPAYFEGKWLIGEWNGGNARVVSFDEDGELLEISPFVPDAFEPQSPHAMELGPDGHFYYLDWGDDWSGHADPRLYRFEHSVIDVELNGKFSGWEGASPSDIEGETNPTLEFEAGEHVVLKWRNADGAGHNFVIADDAGDELFHTEHVHEQGETQIVEFVATEEMAEYYCHPHQNTMRGDIEVGSSNDIA